MISCSAKLSDNQTLWGRNHLLNKGNASTFMSLQRLRTALEILALVNFCSDAVSSWSGSSLLACPNPQWARLRTWPQRSRGGSLLERVVGIVLAEIPASAANFLFSFERSFAALSSVCHRAGLQQGPGKAHVWCCVSTPMLMQLTRTFLDLSFSAMPTAALTIFR